MEGVALEQSRALLELQATELRRLRHVAQKDEDLAQRHRELSFALARESQLAQKAAAKLEQQERQLLSLRQQLRDAQRDAEAAAARAAELEQVVKTQEERIEDLALQLSQQQMIKTFLTK